MIYTVRGVIEVDGRIVTICKDVSADGPAEAKERLCNELLGLTVSDVVRKAVDNRRRGVIEDKINH